MSYVNVNIYCICCALCVQYSMLEDKDSGTVYSVLMDCYFYCTKESALIKCKLHPGQKKMYNAPDTTHALSKHLRRKHPNTKLAENPERR